MIMAMMAGCGLPGFANFVGEVMVFFAAWERFPVVTILAVWGALVIGAVYMLRAIRKVLHGVAAPAASELKDASAWRKVPFVLLLAFLLLFGVAPRLLTDKIQPSAQAILTAAGQPPAAPAPVRAAQLTP
jgi:NADH-quinone oxidoreductase subunit M